MKYTTFWNWAQGRTEMPLNVLSKIGEETGYSLNWLLTGEGDKLTVDKKVFNEEELAIKVNNLRYGGFFSIEGFIFELARINDLFRSMLTSEAIAKVKETHEAWMDTIEAFADYADSIEPVRIEPDEIGPMVPVTNRDIMVAPYLGTVDGGEVDVEKVKTRRGLKRKTV